MTVPGVVAMTSNDSPSESKEFVAESLVGHMFADRFRITSLIGNGGMGVVYKAEHTLMHKPMAVKMVLPSVMTSEHAFRRFQQEARAASSLSHPNIITVHDFGVTMEGQAYLIMDFVDGKSLEDVLRDEFALSAKRCLNIICQACDGLGHAHKKGIVHRDIKASNVMIVIDEDGSEIVKIVDFGLAKIVATDEDQHLTRTGAVVGSPLYMSPEQCRGKAIDSRTDIYAVGCLIYKCLTGTVPFQGATVLDTMYMHMTGAPMSLRALNSEADVTTDLEKVILKALEKEPANRQQTMSELKRELTQAIVGQSVAGSAPLTSAGAADPTGFPSEAKSPKSASAAEKLPTSLKTDAVNGIGFRKDGALDLIKSATDDALSLFNGVPSGDKLKQIDSLSSVSKKDLTKIPVHNDQWQRAGQNNPGSIKPRKSKTLPGGIIFGATVAILSCTVSLLSTLLIVRSGIIGNLIGATSVPASSKAMRVKNRSSEEQPKAANVTDGNIDPSGTKTGTVVNPEIGPDTGKRNTERTVLVTDPGTNKGTSTGTESALNAAAGITHPNSQVDAKQALSHKMLADTYYEAENYSRASTEYIQSLNEERKLFGDSDVRLVPTLAHLIDCFLKQDKGTAAGKYVEEAALIYDKNADSFPENPKYFEALGVACVKNRNFTGGLTFLQRSIDLEGAKVHPNVLVALGHAYLETNQAKKALNVLHKAVNQSKGKPVHKAAVRLYIRALIANGKTQEAAAFQQDKGQ